VKRVRPHITVVGLGPAGAPYLSDGVVSLMASASATYLRTSRHPGTDDFKATHSFDHLYETSASFDELYLAIVEELVDAATRHAPDKIVYAVPGSPLVAERSVQLLRDDPRVGVTIIPGLSFLDLAWDRLGIDPLSEGVRLVDAENFTAQTEGQPGPFLVAQCWSRQLLSEVKLSAPSDGDIPLPNVIILHHLGLNDEQILTVKWWDLDRTIAPDHLTSLYIPSLPSHNSLHGEMERLSELMVTLRANCPWDRVQTHRSLMPHLLEETYEVLDVLAAQEVAGVEETSVGPPLHVHLEEELGDLLFQIVFHAYLAEEAGQFTLADVARGIHDKLVHRHPHVFGGHDADSPEQALVNWEAIKTLEKGRSSVTDGIPVNLPALMLTNKLQRKALSVGLEPSGGTEIGRKIQADIALLALKATFQDAPEPDAPDGDDVADAVQLVGTVLLGVVDIARRLGVDAEQALRTRALSLRQSILNSEGVHKP